MGVNSLPKTVTRQRRGCDLNTGFLRLSPARNHSATEPPKYACMGGLFGPFLPVPVTSRSTHCISPQIVTVPRSTAWQFRAHDGRIIMAEIHGECRPLVARRRRIARCV